MVKLAVLPAILALASFGITLGAPAAMSQPVPATQPKAVVELFTSQGCSSCPPADKLFAAMARDPSVIALTLPVDYWDYLGWKDTLANPSFSSRQRHYAQLRGDSNVYTPQAVVNGAGHVVGSDKGKIDQHLGSASLPVAMTIDQAAGGLTIGVAAHELGKDMGRMAKRGDIFLLPVLRTAQVPITRGENRGKSITYAQVVRGIHPVGSWNGEAASIALSGDKLKALAGVEGSDGFVVILQVEGKKHAKIIGAARSKGLEPPSS
ncbi:MAG: DUF1223 domain-containing protein [Bosea sp. (in: a-proteobacteria)]